MTQPIEVSGEFKNGIPVITARYTTGYLLEPRTGRTLSELMVERYKELRGDEQASTAPKAWILAIEAKAAGTPVVRGIYELFRVVSAQGGTLFVASYPPNYLDSLTSLGLPALTGFRLVDSVDAALKEIDRK